MTDKFEAGFNAAWSEAERTMKGKGLARAGQELVRQHGGGRYILFRGGPFDSTEAYMTADQCKPGGVIVRIGACPSDAFHTFVKHQDRTHHDPSYVVCECPEEWYGPQEYQWDANLQVAVWVRQRPWPKTEETDEKIIWLADGGQYRAP